MFVRFFHYTTIQRSKSEMYMLYANFQHKLRVSTKMKPLNLGGKIIICTDMRIVAGTAGMPEEPPKKNTLKIKILFASQ